MAFGAHRLPPAKYPTRPCPGLARSSQVFLMVTLSMTTFSLGGPSPFPLSVPAAAGPGRVAALEHVDPAGGQAVAAGVVEVVLAGQVDERVDRARRLGVQQVDDDVAAVRLDRRLVVRLQVRLGGRQADLA